MQEYKNYANSFFFYSFILAIDLLRLKDRIMRCPHLPNDLRVFSTQLL